MLKRLDLENLLNIQAEADPKRRSDIKVITKGMKGIVEHLNQMGYQISRQSVSLRLRLIKLNSNQGNFVEFS